MTRLYSLSMECRGSLVLFQSLLPASVSSGCSLDITITTCSNCKRKMLSLAAVDKSVAGPAALVQLTKPLSEPEFGLDLSHLRLDLAAHRSNTDHGVIRARIRL